MTTATTPKLPTSVVPHNNRSISPEAAAAVRAAEDFARTHDQSKLIPLLGTFDDMLSAEEFDRLREMD